MIKLKYFVKWFYNRNVICVYSSNGNLIKVFNSTLDCNNYYKLKSKSITKNIFNNKSRLALHKELNLYFISKKYKYITTNIVI